MKVVINRCYGGFGLSKEAKLAILERKGLAGRAVLTDWSLIEKQVEGFKDGEWIDFDSFKFPRHDSDLVAVVETMGSESYDGFADLRVINVPDGIEYIIFDNEGMETVVESGHYWDR